VAVAGKTTITTGLAGQQHAWSVTENGAAHSGSISTLPTAAPW
jgi:hypothetical protein